MVPNEWCQGRRNGPQLMVAVTAEVIVPHKLIH
jgi:hypothetical protein